MADNRIQYTARNYDDYKSQIIALTKQYYPNMMQSYSDAAIGKWLIELYASIADELSYHIDRTFQETSLESAQTTASLMNMARNNGIKVPGPKGAVVEVELSCVIPTNDADGSARLADESFCPVVKRGTKFVTGSSVFELKYDVYFNQQFDYNGLSDRQIIPQRNANGVITSYLYKKLGIAVAGETKIYRKAVTQSDIKPFMEITLTDANILGVESIIVKEGTDFNTDPPVSQFYVDEEEYREMPTNGSEKGKLIRRFFEVDSLAEQYRFGHEMETVSSSDGTVVLYNPVYETEDVVVNDKTAVTLRKVMKGCWKRFKNKFITEWTSNWNLRIIFGSGIRNKYGDIPSDAQNFTQYMMSRMHANDYMGVLPEPGATMYVLYRTGGGEQSNIAAGALTTIQYLNVGMTECVDAAKASAVYRSLRVTNTTPSYGGKDRPSTEELRHYIKFATATQNRCVTINDYYARIAQVPPQYGCPFRHSVVEENNKVAVYCLGLDHNGNLTPALAETVAENLKNYLSRYRMINDFIEIKSGKVINISFDLNVFIDKAYDRSEVVKRIIDKVCEYMDIRRHQMGEDIFLGDLHKEISRLDGVVNMVSMYVTNETGDGYSKDMIAQPLMTPYTCQMGETDIDTAGNVVDLEYSDNILYGDAFSMYEIKNKSTDVRVKTKTR